MLVNSNIKKGKIPPKWDGNSGNRIGEIINKVVKKPKWKAIWYRENGLNIYDAALYVYNMDNVLEQ